MLVEKEYKGALNLVNIAPVLVRWCRHVARRVGRVLKVGTKLHKSLMLVFWMSSVR